jgi:hypothetical protein
MSLDECGIVAVGNEADFLAFGLVGGLETMPSRNFPDLFFRQFAEGKKGSGKLILAQLE